MNEDNYSKAYAEILHLLKGFSKEEIDKIPQDLLDYFREKADKKYICDFDYTKNIDELHLRDETYGIISMICYNYWCQTDEDKKKYLNILEKNEKYYQEYLKENATGAEEMFEENITYTPEDETTNKIAIKSNEKWYEKIINSFRRLFK